MIRRYNLGTHQDNVDPAKVSRVEIFPPIGIARVGNSGALPDGEPDPKGKIEFFYGPEVPGLTDAPVEQFRDNFGNIKRQAARFRVYAYDDEDKLLGEINSSQGYKLTWSVHVANKKAAYYCSGGILRARNTNLRNPDVDPEPAGQNLTGDPFDRSLETRKKLIVDPGLKKITAGDKPVALKGRFQGSSENPFYAINVTLGELRTDEVGRLVFIPGSGVARSVLGLTTQDQVLQPEIISEFDSTDWIDSVCDGWVDVKVEHPSRPNMIPLWKKPHKATVVSGPPKFAWGIDSPTTMYDLMENFYKEKYLDHDGTDFYKDIWPVLAGTYRLGWVNAKAFQGHGPGGYGDFLPNEEDLSNPKGNAALRQHIFGRLREPNYRNKDQAHVILMPRLSGDNGDAIEPGTTSQVSGEPIQRFAALTELQYERFKDWRDGNFRTGTPFGMRRTIEEYDKNEQPRLLTRAMLEQTIGEPLYPGIETFWIAKLDGTYDLQSTVGLLDPPFRIDHERVLPGFLSRGLSLPWQSDFDLCNTHWWPSARPDDVFVLPGTSGLLNRGNHPDHGDATNSVLKIDDFKDPAVVGISDPARLVGMVPRRKRWTRGLRDTPEEVSASFFPGSTDMVQNWTKLGFVKKFNLVSFGVGGQLPPDVEARPDVWIEQERQLINGFV
ncbi:hypothetical protein BC628DRAFT_1410386 [Trametes gibbosa]|nr:hypothetical protein BC628DRAFT_1410386 [Trametes gibbosa]